MKRLTAAVTLPILALTLAGVPAFAQQDQRPDEHQDQHQDQRQDHHDNHTYSRHDDWKKGGRIQHQDWDRGDKVDYRQHHLRRPSRGYEWREVDGNYVMANQDGVIVSVVPDREHH